MGDTVKLKALLEDAETAYHSLLTGTMARVVVDQNGERVEFTAANRANLYAYIQQLNSQIGITDAARPAAPAMFIF